MARFGLRNGCAGALALSGASALWLACAAAPALAGDDGYAPIWDSLGSVVGFGKDKDDRKIDYRDQPRLVLPPKMELPPPAVAPSASATDWPRDPDIAAVKKEQAEKNKIERPLGDRNRLYDERFQSQKTVVTTNYTAGMGPSQGRCVAGPGQSCDTPHGPTINWNPLTWVGIEKKPQTVLGPEPARTSLTDPPNGFREPAEGVGVKIDN